MKRNVLVNNVVLDFDLVLHHMQDDMIEELNDFDFTPQEFIDEYINRDADFLFILTEEFGVPNPNI